jgi:hypothetical protein
MYKGFQVLGRLNLMLTLDVINVLNRRNVDLNGGGFNTLLGRTLEYGDYNPEDRYIYSWDAYAGGQSFFARVPPFAFRPPRQISLGLKISWD